MSTTIMVGDCRDLLPTLGAGSVHCVVTSPPYFGLRDYGVAGQIGLESSLDAYITTLVAVFREVRRILRNDGTVFLNLGDAYAGSWGNQGRKLERGTQRPINGPMLQPLEDGRYPSNGHNTGKITDATLKPKDLMMVPARVALALQADGWYLRSDIIWHKPNPMPESVTDRPTSSHEHVFLLTKQSRYFYDAEAVAEQSLQPFGAARLTGQHKADAGGFTTNGHGPSTLGTNQGEPSRNLRNVWTIATSPYAAAHFATFPPALVTPCIKAGTSEQGCCAACGAPWVRVVERTRELESLSPRYTGVSLRNDADDPRFSTSVQTLGWHPSCSCDAGTPIPCVCLDPFAGAGTVGLVADRLGRDSILIELSDTYAHMAEARIRGDAPLFTEVMMQTTERG